MFLVLSSPLAFGNSWKATTPPCSDVTTEIFPCERNSYCSAWAQRRCMILTGDTFKDCHLMVWCYYLSCFLHQKGGFRFHEERKSWHSDNCWTKNLLLPVMRPQRDRLRMLVWARFRMFSNLQVDPEPYYHACVQESCSCEFEGKFLGFCTAVAAYAEACSDHNVCVNWRTPDVCRKWALTSLPICS